jgi:radical SAM protein with 4Fe4S-binding SPASM domain
MEPDGQLYACDHLINAEHRLGRLDDRRWLRRSTRDPLPFGSEKACAANARLRGKNGLPGRLPGAS